MKNQRGMTLLSILILGSFAAAVLILGLKMVPVYTEYFGVKKAFAKIVSETDPGAPAGTYRAAFARFSAVDDLESIDPQTIAVSKDAGKVTLEVSYRRELPLFANIGLYFDFDITSD